MQTSTTVDLMPTRDITGDTVQEQGTIPDLLNYGYIVTSFRVFNAASTSGNLALETSAVLSQDDSDWHELYNVSLTATGLTVKTTGGVFLRYVRWRVYNFGSGTATANVQVVAKEST